MAGVSELGCRENWAIGPVNGETGTSVVGAAVDSWDCVEQETRPRGVTVVAGGAVAVKLAETFGVVNP